MALDHGRSLGLGLCLGLGLGLGLDLGLVSGGRVSGGRVQVPGLVLVQVFVQV